MLMNEAGEVSIDGPRAGTIAEQILNLAGGCICCDTKADLAWSIAQLVQDYESTVIVLECSGMADPAEVVDAVTDVYVSRMARLERIFAMLHPVPLPATGMAELVTRNAIRYADDVILNKRDLYIPGHWEQFRESITRLNPHGWLWETNHARLDVAALLAAPPTHPRPTTVQFGKGAWQSHLVNARLQVTNTRRTANPRDHEGRALRKKRTSEGADQLAANRSA